ncbi:MAG TPA: DUF805 domain-containing protein, partial [Chryseosolibacter sp.]|nr:DUF805 domain-containing protein [Chryseosolibacter sp.]
MMDKLFSPEGRIRRSTFWLRVLVAIAIKLVLLIMAAKPSFELLDIVVSVFLSAFLVVGGIKRMHDVNKSGWYFLIPVFGFILALRRGTEGPNTFGADPKDGITNPNKTALGISVMLLVVAVLALNVPLKSSVRPTRSDRVPNTQKSDSLEALWNVDVVNFFEKSLRLKTQVLFPHLQRTMKYGYIDSLGNWVIEPQFEKAEEFTGQTALIKLNGKFGFVN